MSADTFRRTLADAAENAVSERADGIAADVVAAVSNAVDDELGALRERVDKADAARWRYLNWLGDARNAVGAASSADIPARAAELHAERDRYHAAYRSARTRARSTGSAADRYAGYARDGQEALQHMLFATIGAQLAREAARREAAELRAELAARPTRAAVLRRAAREARILSGHRYTADEVARHLDIMADAAERGESPRTELASWVAITDALNAAHDNGLSLGIDLDGTITDHREWAVIWDRESERWTVAEYDDGESTRPADRIVAYRTRDEQQLRCLTCVPRETWTYLDWQALTDVQIDGDARQCTNCGHDVGAIADAEGGDA